MPLQLKLLVPLQSKCIWLGSGTHCPLSVHVDALAPTVTSPGFEQLNTMVVPTTARPLASEMFIEEDPLRTGYMQVTTKIK